MEKRYQTESHVFLVEAFQAVRFSQGIWKQKPDKPTKQDR